MSEELLPCPFCGATPHKGFGKTQFGQADGEPFQRFLIWCPRQHAKFNEMNEAQAIKAWNTRPALIDHLESDGMVLVPREPTEAMLAAWCRAEDTMDMRGCYAAMLSALPVLGVGR